MKTALALFILFPIVATAEDEAIKKVYEACQQDTDVELCVYMQTGLTNIKEYINVVLSEHNAQAASAITFAAVSFATGGSIKVRTGQLPYANNNRSFLRLNDNGVMFNIEWSME
jgi:hypothetical protein